LTGLEILFMQLKGTFFHRKIIFKNTIKNTYKSISMLKKSISKLVKSSNRQSPVQQFSKSQKSPGDNLTLND
jgi:hypothetical protein